MARASSSDVDERLDGWWAHVDRKLAGLGAGSLFMPAACALAVLLVGALPLPDPSGQVLAACLAAMAVWLNARRARYADAASRDSLTGLHNKGAEEADLARLTRHKRPFALFFLDIDRFKLINDNYGHAVGDDVLLDFARSVVSCTPRGACAYRVGGDEFVVIVADLADDEGATTFAGRLADAVEHPVSCRGSHTITPATSVGWAVYPKDGTDPSQLATVADERMYAAKRERHARDANEVFDARTRAQDLNLHDTLMRLPTPVVICSTKADLHVMLANDAVLAAVGAASLEDLFATRGCGVAALVGSDAARVLARQLHERIAANELSGPLSAPVTLADAGRPCHVHAALVSDAHHGWVALLTFVPV